MKKYGNIALAVLLALCLMAVVLAGCERTECVQTQGLSHFSGPLDIVDTATAAAPALYFAGDSDTGIYSAGANQLGLSTGGTVRLTLSSSGALVTGLDMNGTELILDADADSSFTADTDNKLDLRLGGANIVVFNEWGASSIVGNTTEHLVEIVDASPVITGGTVSLAALNIDLGIGNSTGGTNNIYAILIDDITQDAQNTETAISIGGTGWDVALDAGANTVTNIGNAGTDFTSSGGLTLAGPLSVSPGAADTAVTYGSTITPATSYVVITSTTTITNAVMGACTVAGQFVAITCNAGSGDITITESTTLEAGGSIALDASEEDVVILLCNGTKWLKAGAFADN